MNWELFYLINKSWIDLHAIAFVYVVSFGLLFLIIKIGGIENELA